MTPKAWAALWAVYLIWGSTYLGIKVAGDTIPSFAAVSSRFLIAGSLKAGWVVATGSRSVSISRRELASATLIGLLLPGANGLLFVGSAPFRPASLHSSSRRCRCSSSSCGSPAVSARLDSPSPASSSASRGSRSCFTPKAERRGGGSRAYVNPVVAIGLGVLFLDERITWRIALGAAIVLASVAVVVRRESEAAVEPFAE